MSRGGDDIIRECLASLGLHHKHHSQAWVAETILEALEAEDWLAVHRDSTLMFAEDVHFNFGVLMRFRWIRGNGISFTIDANHDNSLDVIARAIDAIDKYRSESGEVTVSEQAELIRQSLLELTRQRVTKQRTHG